MTSLPGRPAPADISDDGYVTAFFAILVVALFALAGLALDGGGALNAKTRAISTAAEAARAGAQALDLAVYRADGTRQLDPEQARARALAFLAGADADGTASATLTTVTVTVTATYQPQLLTLVGVGPLHLTGTASASPRSGPVP
ncbi:putative Flp pilus-assembly TadE/G [Frankia torreyi]|uniref:Putative Flp pilus-assembly TadE/G n=1 Tax=Frankia torreyi TaxID=1856 RepID=A0A0D8B7S4_9ACTN|nr:MULTISPECIES: pilus assembly protein TadG-related protein [Frankia]KJE19432.1 putative Flp pilus-assembly TadE/G [Frankia torreyi]KQM03604.1 putative Flp pilus-assembly TadE/G [Frankia sp. CpI1-P]